MRILFCRVRMVKLKKYVLKKANQIRLVGFNLI